MRRAGALVVGALLVATLTACSSGSSGKPAAAPSVKPTVSKQAQFLQAVHQANLQSWATAAPTDDEIAAFPDQWCTQLAAGHSVNNIFSVRSGFYPNGPDWGTKIGDADQLLVTAVTIYCPQYRADVVQQVQASGNY